MLSLLVKQAAAGPREVLDACLPPAPPAATGSYSCLRHTTKASDALPCACQQLHTTLKPGTNPPVHNCASLLAVLFVHAQCCFMPHNRLSITRVSAWHRTMLQRLTTHAHCTQAIHKQKQAPLLPVQLAHTPKCCRSSVHAVPAGIIPNCSTSFAQKPPAPTTAQQQQRTSGRADMHHQATRPQASKPAALSTRTCTSPGCLETGGANARAGQLNAQPANQQRAMQPMSACTLHMHKQATPLKPDQHSRDWPAIAALNALVWLNRPGRRLAAATRLPCTSLRNMS